MGASPDPRAFGTKRSPNGPYERSIITPGHTGQGPAVQYPDITFNGKSGERYRFQAWSLETRFKPVAAVYVVTRRAQDNSTYRRASHENVYIGQTASLADPFGTESQFECFRKHGANCICICLLENEAQRIALEEDLIALHGTHCNQMKRLSRIFDAVGEAGDAVMK
jgi:hypothetical protein